MDNLVLVPPCMAHCASAAFFPRTLKSINPKNAQLIISVKCKQTICLLLGEQLIENQKSETYVLPTAISL